MRHIYSSSKLVPLLLLGTRAVLASTQLYTTLLVMPASILSVVSSYLLALFVHPFPRGSLNFKMYISIFRETSHKYSLHISLGFVLLFYMYTSILYPDFSCVKISWEKYRILNLENSVASLLMDIEKGGLRLQKWWRVV